MKDRSTIMIFLDEEKVPLAQFDAPSHFELDTTRIPDGKHQLRIVSKDPSGKEGIRIIPFEVRNGPAIAVEGIKEDQVLDGVIPVMVNAYGKGDQKQFLIEGSESPRSIPFWVFVLVIAFLGWAIFYYFRMSEVPLY